LIGTDEIDSVAGQLEVHVANVQRDYVFGWLLKAISEDPYLGSLLVLKGATCLRKIYLPQSRFSEDLDFSTVSAIDDREFVAALGRCCEQVQRATCVSFNIDRTSVRLHRTVMTRDVVKEVYRAHLFFLDFYGVEEELTIAVQMDVTSFESPVLETKRLPMVHPFSDSELCRATIHCISLEELVATKMKCLLQRRHVPDLFDMAYSYLWCKALAVDRSKVLTAFIRKTIFRSSPGSARDILLGLPVDGFRDDWQDRIVYPVDSRLGLDEAIERFKGFVRELFSGERVHPFRSDAFFSADLRYPIIQAGADRRLIRLTYDGALRLVEPYALLFKKPEHGDAREYFYCWNVVGGSSEPGWRSLLGNKITSLTVTDQAFEPREEVQLSKAGEMPKVGSFSRSTVGGSRVRTNPMPRATGRMFSQQFTIQCPYCQKKFRRSTLDTVLKPHKSPDGYPCGARRGYLV